MSEESFEEQASLRGVHVLLVADDPESRELMKTVLEYAAALVSTAASARGALGALEAIRPDLLLCDLSSGGGENALWLIEHTRALPWGADIPAIVVTTRAARDERQRLLKAGFQEHFVKPVDPWELCRRVASLVTRDP
jgi:CheY-like chemotaxis protein